MMDFNFDEDEEDFLDDILKNARIEEEEELEKERIKNLLREKATLFYNEILKDERLLTLDQSIELENKKTFLENMLNLFVEFEEYEKCADIHRWKNLIGEDNAKHTRRKSKKL